MPDEDSALAEEIMHVVDVSNAVRAACKFDAMQVARGLIRIAQMMAGDDPTAKTAIGKEMCMAALELDPHLFKVRYQ